MRSTAGVRELLDRFTRYVVSMTSDWDNSFWMGVALYYFPSLFQLSTVPEAARVSFCLLTVAGVLLSYCNTRCLVLALFGKDRRLCRKAFRGLLAVICWMTVNFVLSSYFGIF